MKPILFNTEMARAILDGRKTVTRRVIKFKPGMTGRLPSDGSRDYLFYPGEIEYPLYCPGDILYVRETFFEYKGHYYYKADEKHETLDALIGGSFFKWRPSIHMPKEAARLFLRVTDVRVERLQDMTIYGLQNEGFLGDGYISQYAALSEDHFNGFKALWDSTIKKADLDKYGWEANPLCWAISFEKISKEEAMENA